MTDCPEQWAMDLYITSTNTIITSYNFLVNIVAYILVQKPKHIGSQGSAS